jgi:hypothetical protein
MHTFLCPRDENYTYTSITSDYILASSPQHEPNVALLRQLVPPVCISGGLSPSSHLCGSCSVLTYSTHSLGNHKLHKIELQLLYLSLALHGLTRRPGASIKDAIFEELCLYLNVQETRIPGILIAR